MARSDFAWVNFDTEFSTANPQATRTFQIEGIPLAGESFYLLIQGLDINLPGHQILINGVAQSDPDIPPQGEGRWTTWMDRIPPNRLHSGSNTITIVAAKSSLPGISGGPVVVTDPFYVASVAIHWREAG